jgi:hypothetical protein
MEIDFRIGPGHAAAPRPSSGDFLNSPAIFLQPFTAEKTHGTVRHLHHVGIGVSAFEDGRFLALLPAVTDDDLVANGKVCHRSGSRSAPRLFVIHAGPMQDKIEIFHRAGTTSRESSPGSSSVAAV